MQKPWKPLAQVSFGEFLEKTPFYASVEFRGIPSPHGRQRPQKDISPDGSTELTELRGL